MSTRSFKIGSFLIIDTGQGRASGADLNQRTSVAKRTIKRQVYVNFEPEKVKNDRNF